MSKKFLIGVVMMVGLLAGLAQAATYSANAGIYDHPGLTDHTGAAQTVGNQVQYINLTTGVIYGPTDAGGSVNGAYEAVCPALYPPNDRKVGYDSTLTNLITNPPQAGEFWHQAGVDAGAPQSFIVRAWEGADPSSAAYFGESIVFQSQLTPTEPPSNTTLSNFQTRFPKSVPDAPALAGGYPAVVRGVGGTAPRLDVRFGTVLGARAFEVQLSRDNFTSTFVQGLGFYKDGYHTLYDSSEAARANTYTLANSDQGQTIYYRVRAWNSFGYSTGWTQGSIAIPQNLDVSTPEAVTDLVATVNGNNITLSWTAAYDLDNSGVLAACASYEIRVSGEALVDAAATPFDPAKTNPSGVSNWAAARPISGYFASAPVIPAPLIFNLNNHQSVTITGAPNGNYYFGLKASDASGNISNLSNIAGAQTGGGGTGQLTRTLTIESRVNANPPGHGINHFSLPFPGPWYTYKGDGTTPLKQIANAYDLVTAINSAAGANIVSTFTRWVGANSTPNETGVIITNNDPEASAVKAALQAIPLDNGTAFELYATQSIRIVIKNY